MHLTPVLTPAIPKIRQIMLQSISHNRPSGKPVKPRRDFPLFPHATGRWAKKVRGKFAYFGKVSDDPHGKAALELWLQQRDDLLSSRTPRSAGDGLSIRDLANRFLTVKQHQVQTKEITQRHFNALFTVCQLIIDHFGKSRLVDDLAADDFESLRTSLAKTRGAWALGGTVAKMRSVFKYGYEVGLMNQPVRYGPNFKRPSKAAIRRERSNKPPRLFSAAELQKIIGAADGQLKAMIMLGINCGLGNADCGQLAFHHIDLRNGWLHYPRPKTGIHRRCPLWPETISELKEAIQTRPEPKDDANRSLVFITKYGQPWYHDKDGASALGHEFRKLLVTSKQRRDGLSFFTLRHTFATEAGGSRDQVAVDLIMGHADHSMAAHYRERIDDLRLIAVTDHVRNWLWPPKKRKAK
jgi:integrase